MDAPGVRTVGGTKSLNDLIAGCERGVLCTHFFDMNVLDPRSTMLTGITLDGTFLIEQGKVARATDAGKGLQLCEPVGRGVARSGCYVPPAMRVRN